MITPPKFEIQSQLNQDAARVMVTGELDLATIPRLKAETDALLDRSVRHLTLDLSQLTFVDSSGLSLFISLHERATAEGWTLSLTRPSGKTFSVFSITGADANLPFVEDQDIS
jgi:anti-anti-sigma factor